MTPASLPQLIWFFESSLRIDTAHYITSKCGGTTSFFRQNMTFTSYCTHSAARVLLLHIFFCEEVRKWSAHSLHNLVEVPSQQMPVVFKNNFFPPQFMLLNSNHNITVYVHVSHVPVHAGTHVFGVPQYLNN